MRLAWFTPLPPVQSGIAAYSAEVLPRLTGFAAVDVFVEDPKRHDAAAGYRVASAHDFVWRHDRLPYDLIVYQLGNASCHDYMWPYLVRHPGLVVLHDSRLHHARAKRLLRHGRQDDYRAEFAFDHPDVSPAVAEHGVAGLGGPLPYFWPMVRTVAEASRLIAVHSERIAADLREAYPQASVTTIPMGVGDPADASAGDARQMIRARHGIAADAVVFTAFGHVTPEKRVAQAIAALPMVARAVPSVRLLLVGAEATHYDARADAEAAGVSDRVVITGYVEDAALAGYMAATDVALCLRWPSAGETSASWLRCLAAGLPAIITDLAHTVDVPTLDPRTWVLQQAPPDGEAAAPVAVAVAVDILDEDHSLRLAMRRLATDAAMRQALGQAARRYWQERHTIDRMVAAYQLAIDAARQRPAPSTTGLPAHLRDEAVEHGRGLLAPFGIQVDTLA